MNKNRLYIVPVELYNHKVACLVTKSPTAVESAFRRLDWSVELSRGDRSKIEAGTGGLCWYGPQNLTVIWVGKNPNDPYSHAILAHECLHAAVQLLNMRGVPIRADCDEAITWLFDFIYQKFLEKMKVK